MKRTTIEGCRESLAYISSYYDVPAALGQRVIADGRPGAVVWAKGAYLVVLLDGDKRPGLWHPTWHMEYVADTA